MDPTITTAALTALATTLVAKGAKGPAETINLLWLVSFGRINPYLQKIVSEHEASVLGYANTINDKVAPIPDECINKNPDISVLGPALEASKYYVENETIREMFANLISSELDLRKADKVHHSFVDAIKQFSSNDAKLLSILPATGPLVEFRLYHQDDKNYYDRIGFMDTIYIPGLCDDNFESNAVSINNLNRLGIVEIDHSRSLTDKSHYKPYESLPLYLEGNVLLTQNPDKYSQFVMDEGMFIMTPYGDLFKSLCL